MAAQPPLVRSITQAGDAKVGLNFLDVAPPASVVGSQSKTLGIVGAFPWGPLNTPTLCLSFAEFLATFYPPAFGPPDVSTYPAMKAFLGMSKIPGPFYVVRIAPTSVSDSAATLTYTVTGGSWVGTATYKGSLGSLITATWAAATDADSTHRDLTISISTGGKTYYSKTYTNVTTTSILTLGDPYVTWTAGSSPSVLPAAAAAATTGGGAAGTAAASDYVGSSSSSVGIRLFYTTRVDVLFVAECPSGIVDAVNTGLKAYGQSAGLDGMYVLCSVPSQTAANAVTYIASYTDNTSKGVYVWPRLKVPNGYTDLSSVTVDGNAAAACAIAGADAWMSPEFGTSAPYLTTVSDLETNNSAAGTLDTLKAAGIDMFYLDPVLGPILGAAVVTNTTSGQTMIKRSKYRKYLDDKIQTLTPYYMGKPLDVNLSAQTLGEYSSGLVGAIKAFLADEKAKGRIAAYSVDPFGSNTSGSIAANQWTIAIAVQLYGDVEVLTVQTQIGTTVNITST